jgi:hypothetical protein
MLTRAWGRVRWVSTAALLGLSAVPTAAQTLSAPSLSNASSMPEFSDGNPSWQRTSGTEILSATATSFATRYFGNASADCGANCDSRTETLKSNYTVSWTAAAPNLYVLRIDTRRTAGLTIGDEGTDGAQARMGPLSCTPSGGTVVSGACALTDPGDNSSGDTSDVSVNQVNSLAVCGQSLGIPQGHSVNFTWSQSAVSPSTGLFGNGDEAAVRLGASNRDSSNGAADYPGIKSRVRSNDGHFVSVTITSLCGNGTIDSCGAVSEQCDDGPANGTARSCCTARCTLRANGDACTDDVFCNGADACQDGKCIVHAGDPCAGGPECNNVCNEGGQNCHADAGVPCTDDNNSCTDDACDGAGTCGHPARDKQPCPAPACYQIGQCNGTICHGENILPDCFTGCSNPPRQKGSPCTAPNGKPSTCDGQGTCLPPGICGNGVVEPAEECEPDQGECCVPAGQPGECHYRGPTEQCGQETRKCHTQFQCTGRSAMCPTDQSNLADPGTLCVYDPDPDCVVSTCDGSGACQAVDRVCMADASPPKRRTRHPVVVVRCFSDEPGACSATLELEPGSTADESSLAEAARARASRSSPVRTPRRSCPDLPQTPTDLTGRRQVKRRVLRGDEAPAPGLTHLTIIRLHLNGFGENLLPCNQLPVIARVTLMRGGKQLGPITHLLMLLQAPSRR